MARRLITIRWSLLRNLLFLIALLSGSIFAFTFLRARQLVLDLTTDLVDRTTDHTEAELRRFFEPITAALRVARDWSRRGMLRSRERSGVNRLLEPLMRQFPQISSVNTGDPDGGGILLLREEGGWRNREVQRDVWGARVRWTRLGPDLADVQSWEETLDYDPRVRPWYVGAMAAAPAPGEAGVGIHWTEPYTFFTTQDAGVTASVRTWDAEGRPFVVAFDLLLTDVSEFTMGLEPTPRGRAFVVAADGRLVGLPHDERWVDAVARREVILRPAAEAGLVPVAEAVRRGLAPRSGTVRSISFEADGETWIGGLRPFELEGGPTLYMGVVVPESDLLGDIRRERNLILFLTLAALAAAVFISVVLARRYSRPLRELVAQSEKIRKLDMQAGHFTPTGLAEVRQLHDAQERMRRALDSFARYVPTEVVRDLLRRGEAARIGGRVETLTVLFTDIAGFTTVSEGMTPAELTAHMAEYFEVVLDSLHETGATIDKLIGDAVIAFWGAPSPVPAHEQAAVEGVLRCREQLATRQEEWHAAGKPRLPTRFGLATGSVVVGNVGTPSRLHYTALGDTMNLASRLEGANKVYGTQILAESATVERAGDGFVWRQVDRVAVKGRRGPVDLYELLGRRGEVDAEILRRAHLYGEAFAAYRQRRFSDAVAVLRELEGNEPADAAVLRLLHLCRQLRGHPPEDDWDGVARLAEK